MCVCVLGHYRHSRIQHLYFTHRALIGMTTIFLASLLQLPIDYHGIIRQLSFTSLTSCRSLSLCDYGRFRLCLDQVVDKEPTSLPQLYCSYSNVPTAILDKNKQPMRSL